MRAYTLARVKNRADFEQHLSDIEKAPISCFNWPQVNKLEPVSYAAAAYDEEALHVYLCTAEPVLRSEVTEQNGPVHTDSCLEFFFMPTPAKSAHYFNFEINPRGVFLLGLGTGRHERRLITDENAVYFNIKAHAKHDSLFSTGWDVFYSLPFVFIKKYIPEFTPDDLRSMKGNFYKCGDLLPSPHWASWAPITTPKPDFHRPEFFAPIHT